MSAIVHSMYGIPEALSQNLYYRPPELCSDVFTSPLKLTLLFSASVGLIWTLWTVYLDRKTISGFPVVGHRYSWDVFRFIARLNFMFNTEKVIRQGQEQYGEEAVFQVVGHSTPYLIVPPKFMHELRNHKDLSQTHAVLQDFFKEYKPFRTVALALRDDFVFDLVQKKLTQALPLAAEAVNDENKTAIPSNWPEEKEWTQHHFVRHVRNLVAQVSSRVFLGYPMCRDNKWIEIAQHYTMDLAVASISLQLIPRQLRPFVWRFLPPMYKLQRTCNRAKDLLNSELDRRQKVKAAATARGENPPQYHDALEWMMEMPKSTPCDITAGQLFLTFAAVHTTTLTLTHLMYDIIDHDLIEDLREEMIAVFRDVGTWNKTALHKLRLLDSVMKESQRLNPFGSVPLHRYALKDVILSNGDVIRAGTRFMTPNFHLTSEGYYKDPKIFDGRRYLNLSEQAGGSMEFQFTAPRINSPGFGIGNHSCPGRFFVSHEIKLIMAFLLIRYDWKFTKDGRPPKALSFGGSNMADESVPIMYRSRTPEIVF